MRKSSESLRFLVLSAMFAALIFVSITVMAIPNGLGGVIHFGDSLVYLSAAILPFPYGLFVAGIGPGLFNLARVPIWLPFTLVIKPLMSLCFRNKGKKILCRENMIAPFAAGVINVGLYFVANMAVRGTQGSYLTAGVAALPGLAIQSGGSVVFFFVIAAVLDKLKFKERFVGS
jgi:uncharacterized repeat protein (TIGR04002 family)